MEIRITYTFAFDSQKQGDGWQRWPLVSNKHRMRSVCKVVLCRLSTVPVLYQSCTSMYRQLIHLLCHQLWVETMVMHQNCNCKYLHTEIIDICARFHWPVHGLYKNSHIVGTVIASMEWGQDPWYRHCIHTMYGVWYSALVLWHRTLPSCCPQHWTLSPSSHACELSLLHFDWYYLVPSDSNCLFLNSIG